MACWNSRVEAVRLLLDEMLSPRIAVELRASGHDALAVKEVADVVGASDEVVLAFARREGRALVTNNVRDFRRLGAEAMIPGGLGHQGLVLISSSIRRTRADVATIVKLLDDLLRAHAQTGLVEREIWL